MSTNDLILVLGSSRSGTSAITRLISLCGCNLPEEVVGATHLNPTGHWEPTEATRLNVDFICRYGPAEDPSLLLQEIDITAKDREHFIQQIQSFLSKCPKGKPLVVKEFRINDLMEFWLEAARRQNLLVKVVIALRHPQEVFESINAIMNSSRSQAVASDAPKMSLERFSTFWLKVNLLAERHSRGLPRVIVDYSNLIRDWRIEIARVSKALSINFDIEEASIERFLTPSLHRRRYNGPITDTFSYSWMTRVYAILSAAAQDAHVDLSSLDEIYHGYRANARAFRISFDEVGIRHNEQLQRFVDRLPTWRSGHDF